MSVPWAMLMAVMLVVLVAVQPVHAENRPGTLLRETVDQLFDELSNNRSRYDADKCQLYSIVNRLVRPLFAIDKVASPDMRNRFSRAFMEMLIRTYAISMFEYTDQELALNPPETLEFDKSGGIALLRHRVPVSGQAPVLVDYALRRTTDNQWQVLDIKIDHISLVWTYRLQYDHMIRNKGFEPLLFALEKKVEDC